MFVVASLYYTKPDATVYCSLIHLLHLCYYVAY